MIFILSSNYKIGFHRFFALQIRTTHFLSLKSILRLFIFHDNISCGRAAFCDYTVRSALSPPHSSMAPGAATQD